MAAELGIEEGLSPEGAIADAERGLIRRALAKCNRMLVAAPATEVAWRLKAEVCQQLGFHAAAARMLLHAAEVARAPGLLFGAALSLQEIGRDAEAISVYRRLLAWLPDAPCAPRAWSNLGNALSALGRRDEADRAHARAFASAPEHAAIAFDYVRHLHAGECWLTSLPVLESALAVIADASARLALLLCLAHARAELEDGDGALAAADAALDLDGCSVGARFMRGRALCLTGRLREGMAEMRHVLLLDPGNRDAADAVQHLEGAGIALPLAS